MPPVQQVACRDAVPGFGEAQSIINLRK